MEQKKKNNLKQNKISYYWRVKEPDKKLEEDNNIEISQKHDDPIQNEHNQEVLRSSSSVIPLESLSCLGSLSSLDNIEKQKERGNEEEYRLQFDGGSRGNPGPSGSGTVIYNNKNEIIWSNSSFYHHQTNNYAEYMGLIKGLEKAVEMGIKRLRVEGDSQLVIQQVQGNFKCKHPNILPLYQRARELKNRIESIQFAHIYRHLNKVADALANCGMDKGFNEKQLEDRNKKERLVQIKKRRRSRKNKKIIVSTANTNVISSLGNNVISSIKSAEKENKVENRLSENKDKQEKIVKKRRRIRKKKTNVKDEIIIN